MSRIKPTYDIQCSYCDTPFRARRDSLLEGLIKSCGCFQKKMGRLQGLANKVHGRTAMKNGKLWRSPTFYSRCSMKYRCLNPKQKSYSLYGARGITICSRWKTSFVAFLEDMGERPKGTTLDRINNLGNYEPSNCRWATYIQQSNNRRNNVN